MSGRPPIDNFQLESFRVTFFKSTPSDPKPDLFLSLLGESPLSTQTISFPQKTMISEGIVENVHYTIEDSFIVINLVFYGVDQVNPSDGTPLPIIYYKQSVEILERLWGRIQNFPEILNAPRMAIAPVYFIPVDNKISGYEVISEFLPFNVDGNKSSDFLFQINNPTLQHFPTGKNYTLNTIVHFSVIVISTFPIGLPGVAVPPVRLKEIYRARIQFDVNNAPNSKPENTEETTTLYKNCLESITRTLVDGITL